MYKGYQHIIVNQ